jgi:two-component system LytT family response regulator
VKIRAVIVDDEELARRGIAARLSRFDDVEVISQCKNAREAMTAIRELKPDVVFLDIQMPGRTGFDLVESVGMPPPWFVFVTAHDAHAIQAFEVNALDYVLKPINDERLENAVRRVRNLIAQSDHTDIDDRVKNMIKILDRKLQSIEDVSEDNELVVRSDGRIRLIRIPEVDWIQAAGDYVNLFQGKKSVLMHTTISSLEQKLENHGFLRIHRSIIVNRKRITELHPIQNGEYDVILSDGTELKLSRNYRHALKEILPGMSK